MLNVLFVNSGILGHGVVAELLEDAAARLPDMTATHVNLSHDLTVRDRVVRRLLCARLAPAAGWAANVDLARWRRPRPRRTRGRREPWGRPVRIVRRRSA